jgi:hypothetical protein
MQTASGTHARGGYSQVIAAADVQGTSVTNPASENLGTIKDVVLDKHDGTVRYAVLQFGGFLGMGSKLFALPWELLRYDASADAYVLAIPKETLQAAPGFDSDHWPDMSAVTFDTDLRRHYGLADMAAGRTPPIV